MKMLITTEFYLFNEDGFLDFDNLPFLCETLSKRLNFSIDDSESSRFVYCKLTRDNNEITFYESGYVVKFEGDLLMSITFLNEFDNLLDSHIDYYLSPIQAIENAKELSYPRGIGGIEIAHFLDERFCSKDYSDAFKMR